MNDKIIIKVVTRILLPFMQLFALYVLAHGDLGPGGGFQGGVIIGATIILYAMVFGVKEGRRMMPQKVSDLLNSTGVLIYGGMGILCLLAGGAYLEYDALPLGSVELAGHLGIYGIEIGVFITVAAVMVTIFFDTVRREDD